MKILVVSCSTNPESRSRSLAQLASQYVTETPGCEAELVDLMDYPLPLCDGGAAYGDANVQELSAKVAEAKGYIMVAPIYTFDVNAVAKNFVELTGRQMSDKTVSFACAAGGEGSYMSLMGIANSLMLDFRCLIVPRFVYTTGKHYNDKQELVDADIKARLQQMVAVTCELAERYEPIEKKDV